MARELHVLEAPGAPYEVVAAARGLAAAVVDRAVRDLAGNDGGAPVAARTACAAVVRGTRH